jgi:hypothetical protein
MVRSYGKGKAFINDQNKLTLPKLEDLNAQKERLNKIKNYEFSKEEILERINKKKEMKIINQDKNINITYELSTLQEEYNAAKQSYDETKNLTFLNKMNELQPKIDNLLRMAERREKEETVKMESDTVAQINKKTLEKQKLNDMNLLNRKKYREGEVILNKRKDCKPVNLFNSGHMNKEDEEITKSTENGLNRMTSFDPLDSAEKSKAVMRLIHEKIKHFSEEIDEIVKTKKQKAKEKKDDEYMFDLLKINPNVLRKLVESNNQRLPKNMKIITLNDINY